jgi:hypothetical protein
VEERFGDVQDFTPEADGRIPPGRIRSFLSVRDSMSAVRDGMEDLLADLTDDVKHIEERENRFWRILGLARKGFGAVPQIAEFYRVRNHALLANDMGLGEYYYLYVIVYYSWLDKSPGDGPRFRLMGDEGRGGYRWSDEEETDEEDVYEERRYRMVRRARKIVLPMMRRQLDAADSGSGSVSWKRVMEAELERLREDRDRLPWEDGLPRVMTESLAPFRMPLEERYNDYLNPLELGTDDD